MSKKIAFLTTIFPMKREYIYDFFNSLEQQTYKAFDIVVVNDGFKNFKEIKSKYKKLNITELKYSNTPAKNREYGINYCINNRYDIIVFGDSDDFFSKNRVGCSLNMLKRYDIVVNDLTLCDENKKILKENYLSHRVKNYDIIKYNFIKDRNIFGLSNTALKTKLLGSSFKIDKEVVAVDWFMYKKLLSKAKVAVFINECITYYRQHDKNTVGLSLEEGKYPLWWES